MKITAILTLASLAFASAFMPSSLPQTTSRFSSSLRATSLDDMVGADVETGGVAWDPIGFSKLYGDQTENMITLQTLPHPDWLREAEVKHGRVCMLAFLGVVVPHFLGFTAPPYTPNGDWTTSLAHTFYENPAGFYQILFSIFLIEGQTYDQGLWVGKGKRAPGDLGFDPMGFSRGKGDLEKKSMQLKELKNGRLAMIAMAAFASEHMIPGSVPLLTGTGV